jgi:hypothetical protein
MKRYPVVKKEKLLLFVETPHKEGGSSFRQATRKEISNSTIHSAKLDFLRKGVARMNEEIDKLTNECKHPTFYDIEGWPSDTRWCGSCGLFLGSI